MYLIRLEYMSIVSVLENCFDTISNKFVITKRELVVANSCGSLSKRAASIASDEKAQVHER